ncbi:MAG: U32 family peptidase [Bacteroidales bacterium]|nr:U32 family peptidase [Candidatus Hennigimonas equi]
MTKLELLAPALNADIGIAAIRCGADAVYIGGPQFGARAAAGNSIEDIERLCSYARPFGVRIFVTVNTLARDEKEKCEIVRMMAGMKGKGIHAFIIQDTSLLPLLAEQGPWEEEFHASTQCAIRTPFRARELAALGFSRLILERELSLEQIKEIRAAVPDEVELECFVHGALCVCYSGDCYLSEHLTGRSANRGECAQPCRNLYDLVDKRGNTLIAAKPLLSLRDLKLIGRLPELAGAGITSFKIEGRLKNESYVKNVVRAYSEALDRFVENNAGLYCRASLGHVRGGFAPNLDKTFNRGYTSLFIDGKRGKWNSGNYAKGMGESIGTVREVFGRGRNFSITVSGHNGKCPAISNGDGLCFVRRNGEVAGFRADRVEGGKVFCKEMEGLREGMEIWRNIDVRFEKELENNLPDRFIDAALDICFTAGKASVSLVLEDERNLKETFDFRDAAPAENQDRIKAMIITQLGKTSGIFRFTVRNISSDGPLPLISASTLNSIRRHMAEQAATCPPQMDKTPASPASGNAPSHPRREGELMRTKYCILAENDCCLRTEKGRNFAKGGLLLRNNGKLIPLKFDCKNCEMILLEQ